MKNLKKEIEIIFRNSNSPDELFDSLIKALSNKIKDADLYKILLWNKSLSNDEIFMYSEKICHEFPELSYPIFFWVGEIFESVSVYGEYFDNAFRYFVKASTFNPKSPEPYTEILKLYLPELETPKLDDMVSIITQGLLMVERKSPLCFGLAELYNKTGDVNKKRYYQKLGEEFQRVED